MAGVYVFDYNDVDLDTTGLVGDLQPIGCTFYEEKNGESSLTMTLCYDELHKWAAVKVGSYIKAQVPVRIPPKIIDNKYAEEVMIFRVKNSVDAYAYIWQSSGIVERSQGNPMIYPMFMYRSANEKKQVKVKRRIKAGTEVLVLEQHDDGRCKVYLPGVGSGWTVLDNLEQVVSHTIPATFAGVESATTAARLSYQLFQVVTVEQTLDSVTVTARHVFYELATTFTSYKSAWPVEAHKAIEGIFDGLVTPEDRFTCLTDASHKAGALDYERVNMVQALLDPEHGICAQYGLSLIRDNYDLYALKNVGSDRGFVVEYGKNMLSVERIEDISNVVTRIIPFGKDEKGNLVFMDGCIYADSTRIEEYAMPRTMYLDCSDTATESDTMTLTQVRAELKARAEAEFAAGCDLPELTMTVDFISLGDTEEYKQYRDLDKVYLFDKITVKDKVRGYDYNAEVVAVTHNVLTGQLESVTLGSIQKGTGIRKIATWQVPEVDGANIRLQSIAAGVLAGGAVGEDNLQDGSVGTRAIIANSVTTEKLAAGSVTADKIAAGAISADFIEAGSITADKMAAGVLSADLIGAGSITAEKLASGSITTDKLAAKSVTADKLQTDLVISDFIEAGSITTDMLAAGAITAEKMATGVLSADLIGAGSITADKLAAGTITAQSGIIANSAIGTTQIKDGSITSAKIVSLNADVITAGTLSADRLMLKGDNGLYYKINASSSGLTQSELTEEKYKEYIDGSVLVAKSVTTDQLAAASVTANEILSGAITTDKLDASAVTADKIKAGAITTSKVSSDFGKTLDLSSNTSIQAIVKQKAPAYMQLTEPEGEFNIGDIWIRTVRNKAWTDLNKRTWTEVKANAWEQWATSEQPKSYVWTGSKWLLTMDYNAVVQNQTSITQTQKEISLKANQSTLDAVTGKVAVNSSEIRQTAEQITLLVKSSEGMQSQINQQANSISTLVTNGKDMQSQIDQQADSISTLVTDGKGMQSQINQNTHEISLKAGKDDPAKGVVTSSVTVNDSGVAIKTGGTFTVDSQKFDIDTNGEMSAVNARISGQLSVDGNDVWHKGNMVVSTKQPNNVPPGTIWIKPDQSAIPAAGTWSHAALTLRPWSNNYVVELNGTSIGEAPSGATYTYEVSVPVYYAYKKTDTCTCTVYLGATSGAKTISMGAQSFGANNAGGNTYKATVTSKTWLGNSGKIYMLVSFSNGNLMTVDSHSAFACTLMAKSASAEGWKACEVQMYVG